MLHGCTKTGAYPDVEKIALNEEWAKGLIYCDIDCFAMQEDGNLILIDDCGNFAYPPEKRFKVVLEKEPNEPLTLEELSLCNDPVWIKRIGDKDLCDDGWAIVEGPRCLTWHNGVPVSWGIRVWWPGSEVEDCPKYELYGKTWFAYRRPPEGEEENACRM